MINCAGRNYSILYKCGVKEYLVRVEKSLYAGSRGCVSWGSGVRKYFEVRMRLRHDCVISLWLFIVFFGRVIGEENERA